LTGVNNNCYVQVSASAAAFNRDIQAALQSAGDDFRGGALSTLDLAGTSAAVVAPAYSIYTTAAFIVLGVGIGSPLVVLFAGIAFLCYGNSAAQFTRKIPGAGSMVAFSG
jgi:hypothetical protein